MVSLRLSDCIARFVRWTQDNRAARTASHYSYQLGRFAASVGNVNVCRLTPATVANYSSAFAAVQSVQRLLNWLEREERSLTVNPLKGMRKPRLGMRWRVLPRRDLAALLKAAGRPFRRLLILARETAARPQELRALAWSNWRPRPDAPQSSPADALAGSYFVVPAGKGYAWRKAPAAGRVIVLSPRAARLIARLWRRRPAAAAAVLLNSAGRPWSNNAARCRMRRLRVKCGLLSDAAGEKLVLYTLRHTAATRAAAAGIQDFLLAEFLGHSSPRTTERYVHLGPADVAAAFNSHWRPKTHFAG